MSILYKRNKRNRSRKGQIKVFGHRYACTYIRHAYAALHTHTSSMCACAERMRTHTRPKTVAQILRTQ